MREGKVLLIANPTSQRGNGAKGAKIAFDLLSEWLGASRVDSLLTERPGHATHLAQQASNDQYGTIIALGGDGLAHEVINGLMTIDRADRPCFGLIPVGSGNDYGKTLGMSTSVPDAIVQFLDAQERSFDIGCCNGVYFDETLSFGLDAAIALDTIERRKHTNKQGAALYFASGIDQLLHHLDTYAIEVVFDGEHAFKVDVHLLAVQIGPTYGGGFKICPDADPTDGLFDVCWAEAPMRTLEATFKFLMAKDAHHTKFKRINFARARSISITFDREPPCQIDGEPLIARNYEIAMFPQALDVLVASDSPFAR